MPKQTKQVLTENLIWRYLERFGAHIVSFVVSIVLARILVPEDYGIIELVTIFTTILQVFVDGGLGTALIQKHNADDLDFSSVFYFNLVVCIVLYAILFVCSPFIANFYGDLSLASIIRVIGITILISGVKGIQQSFVSRNMLFKRFFFATLGGTLFSAVLGIVMAYDGYGVWALVAQQLSNTTIDTIILWITVRWRPKKMFSWKRLKSLLSYGWKMLASGLIDTFYQNLRSLIIGKIYSSTDLAYYNKGRQFPLLIVSDINSSIDSVLLPTMSNVQDDITAVKMMTRRSIKTSTYIMAPMMIGLACCSESLVRLLLTNKWIECVPYIRIFCVTYMFYPIHTANLNAIKAMGRSDYFLKLEIVKKVVGITVLLSTMWFGVLVMAYSLLFTTVLSMIINSWPNKKLLDYSFGEQMKDILPSILLALFMGVIVYFIGMVNLPSILVLCIQVLVGAIIYIVLSWLFHIDSFEYLLGIVKSGLKKIRK